MQCDTIVTVIVHAYLTKVYPLLGYNSTNISNQANSIPSVNLKRHGVNLRHITPLYFDQPFFLLFMDDIRTIPPVDSDASALSNIPNNLFTGQRMAAISQTSK